MPLVLGLIGGAVIFSLVAMVIAATLFTPDEKARATAALSPRVEAPDYALELLSATSRRSSTSHMTVEGEVRNIGERKLARVLAVVTWRTADGTLILSDDALVDYDPLMPGQATPFKTISRYNPQMASYTVDFRTLRGVAIRTKDSRK